MNLIYETSWRQVDGITVEEATNRARLMFDQYLNSGNEGECDDMACCPPEVAIRRFDPDTGRPQVSYDGGETWGSDPNDIENQIQLYPPLVREGSTNTKCDAATNASEHVNELITSTGENLSTAASVTELAIAVAEALLALFLIIVSAGALTAPVTLVATSIWAAASGAFALGIAGYEAYWTVDKRDAILCALYCNIGSDGQFTEAQYQAFRTKIKTLLPASPAFDIVMTAINAGGARGLSQMASYGNAAEADCSSCDCDEISVYTFTSGGGSVELIPVDGVYTLPAENTFDYGGGYQGVIFFTPDPDVPIGSPQGLITTTTPIVGTPEFAFRLVPPRELVYDYGSAMLYAYRDGAPFSMSFTVVPEA